MVPELLARAVMQDKEIKETQIELEQVRNKSMFAYYIVNLQRIFRTNKFRKVGRYRTNT